MRKGMGSKFWLKSYYIVFLFQTVIFHLSKKANLKFTYYKYNNTTMHIFCIIIDCINIDLMRYL